MKYVRKEGDLQYRVINLRNAGVPAYQDFTAPEQQVEYSADHVIEVRRADGTEVVYHEATRRTANYSRLDTDRIQLPPQLPVTRLWVRKEDGTGIAYKVPANLNAPGEEAEIYLPGAAASVVLEGDKYLQAAYEIICV